MILARDCNSKYSGTPPYGYRVKVVENCSFQLFDFDGSLLQAFITWCYNHSHLNILKIQNDPEPCVQNWLKFANCCLSSCSVPKVDNWCITCAASGATIHDLNVKENVGKTEILTFSGKHNYKSLCCGRASLLAYHNALRCEKTSLSADQNALRIGGTAFSNNDNNKEGQHFHLPFKLRRKFSWLLVYDDDFISMLRRYMSLHLNRFIMPSFR